MDFVGGTRGEKCGSACGEDGVDLRVGDAAGEGLSLCLFGEEDDAVGCYVNV